MNDQFFSSWESFLRSTIPPSLVVEQSAIEKPLTSHHYFSIRGNAEEIQTTLSELQTVFPLIEITQCEDLYLDYRNTCHTSLLCSKNWWLRQRSQPGLRSARLRFCFPLSPLFHDAVVVSHQESDIDVINEKLKVLCPGDEVQLEELARFTFTRYQLQSLVPQGPQDNDNKLSIVLDVVDLPQTDGQQKHLLVGSCRVHGLFTQDHLDLHFDKFKDLSTRHHIQRVPSKIKQILHLQKNPHFDSSSTLLSSDPLCFLKLPVSATPCDISQWFAKVAGGQFGHYAPAFSSMTSYQLSLLTREQILQLGVSEFDLVPLRLHLIASTHFRK